MKQYLQALQDILDHGNDRPDRTGTGTRGIFGYQMRMNLADGFPLLTTKKVWMKGVVHELLWFLKGDTNIKYLVDNGVHIWDAWADKGRAWSGLWPTIAEVGGRGLVGRPNAPLPFC